MGETAAETLKEIDATRNRLDGELRQLEGRLPAAARVAKRAAALAGVWLPGRGGQVRAPAAGQEGRRPPRPRPREAPREAGAPPGRLR